MKPPRNDARAHLAVSEAHIEQTCTQMLELDGWRSLKTDPVSRPQLGKGFGELGMADRLYIRYANQTQACAKSKMFFSQVLAEVMWIEWKRIRPGRLKATKAAGHQVDWITLERKRGALVLLAGVDFPASIEGFKAWYSTSGLMRNRIL